MPQESQEREFVQIEQQVAYYSGPLPPPSMMREYEEVLPGSADRILSLAEQQQKQYATYENRGLLFGFLAVLVLMGLSAFLASLGLASASVAVIIGGIISGAGAFIHGNRTRHHLQRERLAALQKPPPRPELPDGSSESG
ncbi:MAG: DUF2335 domain-containing protein [Chloroflexi bacterium]|nr:DUF2335 domain-containing protein [Chloroflexota bacterium]